MKREDIIKQGKGLFEAYRTHRQVGIPSLTFPDITYEDAYAIQGVLIEELVKSGMTISGKKVGLTSRSMRQTANIYEPDYGFTFYEQAYANESEIPLDLFIHPRIECELLFKLKKDLDKPNVTRQDVIDATEYVVACMEICDFRIFRDEAQRLIQDSIADNAAFGGYIVGDQPFAPDAVDLSLIPYVFEINNHQVEVSCGAAVYDDPALSVAWLANKFNDLNNPLKKGEVILSGSAVASVPVEKGDYLRCSYGAYGEVACKFV